MNKVIEFKNKANDSAEIYFYGEFTTDKYYEDDVTTLDFRNQLKEIGSVKTLNMYFDSFGGNVFVANAIVSMLKRYKEENKVVVNAYVDSASASSSSFLMMVADNIYLYENSVVLIHKPMVSAYSANANDLQDLISSLDTMENNIIVPLYMKHANEGVTAEQIKDVMTKGDWLSAKETKELFDIVIIEENKQMTACVEHDKYIINSYKSIPENLKAKLEQPITENKEELELLKAKLQLALI